MAARRTTALLIGAVLVAGMPVALAAPAPAKETRTVVYTGFGHEVRLGDEGGLRRTGRPFRRFVHHRLRHLWELAGGTRTCRTAASVTVKSWTSAGFARVGEGLYDPCPGGGYNQIYVRRDGRWTAPRALGAQEVRSCSLLRWFGVPRPVADRQCYPDLGALRTYRTYRLPADYSTGDYAARVLAATIEDSTGNADDWAVPAVVSSLRTMRQDGADGFTVVRCFGPDDPLYGALLQGAPRGCQLDVSDGSRLTARDVMRLYPARFGRWSTRSLVEVPAV
jgi:hypothetical protein